MGFYRRRIVPILIRGAMKHREMMRMRAQVVPAARGRVLEIGIGSGLNLPLFGPDVTSVIGIDPSEVLLNSARRAARDVALNVELVEAEAETLPFDAGDFDTVISTWTLCSIPGVATALGEMRRVLKPGGRLVFVEHGRSSDTGIGRWQDRLNPTWRCIAGGCNINRDIFALVREAGFTIAEQESGYLLKAPKILGYSYKGVAEA